MTLDESIQALRPRVIQRAQVLGNVSQACREAAISRTVFYRWRRRWEHNGTDGLPRRPTGSERTGGGRRGPKKVASTSYVRLLESVLVQATLSLLWTSTALALMLVARRQAQRALWVVGAGLLAVVVAKLFVIDLANSATVARIVSFIGVGALLLVIGYAAPVPPAAATDDARKETP